MLFAQLMNHRKIYFYSSLCVALVATIILLVADKKDETLSELVRVSFREVGHKLLRANQDSTSLVLPVQKTAASKYRLSFQNQLALNPDSLVAIVEQSFDKANLPSHYQIEVIQCKDFEVAYSYQKNNDLAKSIIPCSGRFLPQKCYVVEVRFFEKTAASDDKLLWIILIPVSLLFVFVFFPKRKTAKLSYATDDNGISLGKFQFYPDENKLVDQATAINLSKKEVELLTLFVANPNKIIKREELSKKVWEDHGVFVGRSLDTYISKIRKKLNGDETIKLTNVHGIGYMLEVKDFAKC